MPALHHGVDEMRRADHDAVDRALRYLGMIRQQPERGDDAAGHIGAGGSFDRMHDASILQQHRIGIGAAHIDADPPHVWAARVYSLSAPGGGEGRGEVGDSKALADMPTSPSQRGALGPSLSALKGGEGSIGAASNTERKSRS